MEKITIWRLRAGADRRFRSGHPWVYSNELAESPKGIAAGAPVELRDAGGKFLARGYGNPNSLIAFRVLTRDPELAQPDAAETVTQALIRAGKLRVQLGLGDVSHRLCFGEADDLPGLVIDRYRTKNGQVFCVQAHTAGADRWMSSISTTLENYVNQTGLGQWDQTAIVLRNDLGVRKLEGLTEEPARVVKVVASGSLSDIQIQVAGALGESIGFSVDLIEGQKTGFFLDQSANIQLAALRLRKFRGRDPKRLRIIDLCCYVGQWSAQLARMFVQAGLEVEVVAVDASARALEFAKRNIEASGARCEVLKADVLKDLGQLPDRSFDIVVSDPPALIKNRKDIPTGTHAYLQLNTQVFRLVAEGGAVASCSCSGLLEEEAFTQLLSKASYRNRRSVRWVARGSQAPDHPMRMEFPEGRYLKGFIGFA